VANINPLAVRPDEAARILGMGRTKFEEILRRGEIPFIKDGRAVIIAVAELNRWLERRTREASGAEDEA
jgi:excisionase family DNA binding protein